MSTKEKLINKLFQRKLPRDFSKHELDTLMSKCGCKKGPGGRGSGIRYVHEGTGAVLAFDEPHPEENLYPYQIKDTREFLHRIGEH